MDGPEIVVAGRVRGGGFGGKGSGGTGGGGMGGGCVPIPGY